MPNKLIFKLCRAKKRSQAYFMNIGWRQLTDIWHNSFYCDCKQEPHELMLWACLCIIQDDGTSEGKQECVLELCDFTVKIKENQSHNMVKKIQNISKTAFYQQHALHWKIP